MSIPLVQNNEKDSINTSIIAIKRNIERINMLLGLSNSEEIDTSEFVKKSDIVDEVTVGNMQSVTSNAVHRVLFPDYASGSILIEPVSGSGYTVPVDCWCNFLLIANTVGERRLNIDGVIVGSVDSSSNAYVFSFNGFIKAGSLIKRNDNNVINTNQIQLYKLIEQ